VHRPAGGVGGMNTANTTRGSHHHASDAVCSSFILLVLRIDPPMALCTRDASASMYVCIDVRKHRQCANIRTTFFHKRQHVEPQKSSRHHRCAWQVLALLFSTPENTSPVLSVRHSNIVPSVAERMRQLGDGRRTRRHRTEHKISMPE
jgi:hypothetical protein